ncbi:hypothetical protein B0J11DRAFT_613296 [Dendryphion nanum]|uniref:Uncharacterized protein n=1 Tax=Dendryphion nanum TaxID=256645 RepID=A0A9P9E691_9PLEO|nr:hypothetical protein B0J11DRAFT_613296 [Dendryphion nanum]
MAQPRVAANSNTQEPVGRVQGLPFHFWTPNTTSFMKIGDMVAAGPTYSQEAPYQNMIMEILKPYFPTQATIPGGDIWALDRESYRGPANAPSTIKPDGLVIRIRPLNATSSQNTKRDFLWVEVKPASHNTPGGWKDLLGETATRLISAHPTRTVFVLLVVGVRYMVMIWDGGNSMAPNPVPTIIHPATAPFTPWPIDNRFKFPMVVAYYNQVSGIINTRAAASLDSETVYPAGQKPPGRGNLDVLRYEADLATLEQFLITIQQMPLAGNNPGHFF